VFAKTTNLRYQLPTGQLEPVGVWSQYVGPTHHTVTWEPRLPALIPTDTQDELQLTFAPGEEQQSPELADMMFASCPGGHVQLLQELPLDALPPPHEKLYHPAHCAPAAIAINNPGNASTKHFTFFI
jgi:hypothetical protein